MGVCSIVLNDWFFMIVCNDINVSIFLDCIDFNIFTYIVWMQKYPVESVCPQSFHEYILRCCYESMDISTWLPVRAAEGWWCQRQRTGSQSAHFWQRCPLQCRGQESEQRVLTRTLQTLLGNAEMMSATISTVRFSASKHFFHTIVITVTILILRKIMILLSNAFCIIILWWLLLDCLTAQPTEILSRSWLWVSCLLILFQLNGTWLFIIHYTCIAFCSCCWVIQPTYCLDVLSDLLASP